MGFVQVSAPNTNAQNVSQPNVNASNTASTEPIIMHIHPRLNVTIDGDKQVIPSNI
ncbi:MAG: hypothetical protein H0X50_06000 [Nitrosopumilus sp.]|nr:hypothetical protein [Nitrosopumilus sp.]